MAEVFQFVPQRDVDAAKNLSSFIRFNKEALTVFGADLKWQDNSWPTPGVTFGNLDQKTRLLDPTRVMQQPFLEFAKAYFRYQQGHRPTKAHVEIRALRCIERALIETKGDANILSLSTTVLERAATLAKQFFSSGTAYHIGRELVRIAEFVTVKHRLISGHLDWKNPIVRPTDTIRTGLKARQQREKKLPHEDILNALAEIFSSNPNTPKDIFTSSVCAMLLCAPSRISEILALPVDCEVWQTKRDGKKAYGWRFQPGKNAAPCTKWIPEAMVSIAQEAIARIREITDEARKMARWYESKQNLFYRHRDCPDVHEEQPLSIVQASLALGIPVEDETYSRAELRRFGISGKLDTISLKSLNERVVSKLPEGFPWFDKERGIRFSTALFCLQAKQLRTDMPKSPVLLWKASPNTLNDDLSTREASPGYFVPSIFDRHGFNSPGKRSLKANSHQFRHLLNTMAQRGGLSQTEIARWSGRTDIKQNRVYDHMSEFELVDMIRSHDSSLILDRPLEEIAEQIAAKVPMTRQEFNALALPTAHVTEFGFCIHDYTMSPCQRFRDCINCTEQVCVKGDQRVKRLKERLSIVENLRAKAAREIEEGTAGADRWYEIHDITEKRLRELVGIMEDPSIQSGAIIKLRNHNEFSPLKRVLGNGTQQTNTLSVDVKNLLGGGLG